MSSYDEILRMVIQYAIPAGASDSVGVQYYALIGDFFGGVWGTIIGVVTLILVGVTWISSRKIDERSKRYQIFAEMLRTHEEIVSSIKLDDLIGREALSKILSEFYSAYREIKLLNEFDKVELTLQNRIDAAFLIMYYGALPHVVKILEKSYPKLNAQKVCDKISDQKRSTLIKDVRENLNAQLDASKAEKDAWDSAISSCYLIISNNGLPVADKLLLRNTLSTAQNRPYRNIDKNGVINFIEEYATKTEFGGHQNRLSHYFRNLHAAFQYLSDQGFSRSEQRSMAKVLRSKLSNYEQALIALNSLTYQGRSWFESGLLKKYQLIKNIPEYFFEFDSEFVLENEFKMIDFEWSNSMGWWKIHSGPAGRRMVLWGRNHFLWMRFEQRDGFIRRLMIAGPSFAMEHFCRACGQMRSLEEIKK